jgi:hypothetical protein
MNYHYPILSLTSKVSVNTVCLCKLMDIYKVVVKNIFPSNISSMMDTMVGGGVEHPAQGAHSSEQGCVHPELENLGEVTMHKEDGRGNEEGLNEKG